MQSTSPPQLVTLHNLPIPITPFIGRQDEVAQIRQRLRDPDCRLLTLVGPGGIGKTRLALQVAQHLVESGASAHPFPDGIFFIPLTDVGTEEGLVAAIAEAAGLHLYGNERPRQQLLDFLRKKQMLLVLDNFEHLLSVVDLVDTVLSTAPGVKLIITSRVALNLREEWFHAVEGLAVPPMEEGTAIDDYDAVRLFVQSARRARLGFSLADEGAHVLRICRSVGGTPLAIELAATWLKALPTARIADEIERNLDILTTRQHNVSDRHRSMRVVLEQSWQLLAAEEQDALKRLSVLRGGFTQDAAEVVAGASLLTLAILVEKSLLRLDASGRYQIHELTRQYAAEQLAATSEVEEETRTQHSLYYLNFLKARERMLIGQEQQEAAAEISREFENVRSAWLWAIQQNDLEIIQETLPSYFVFHLIRSRLQEGEADLGYLLAHLQKQPGLSGHPAYKPIRARALSRRAAFCYLLGNYDDAKRYAEDGLTVGLEAGCQSDVAFAQIVLGVVAGWQGEKALAEKWLQQSLAISQEIGDKENWADALHELAQIRSSLGDYAEAKRLAQESLAVSRDYGRPDWIAHALVDLGWALVCLGEYAEAEACYQEALAIFELLGHQHGAAGALDGLGWVAWCQEDFETANRYYEQSLGIMRKIGYRRLIANTLCDLAILANEQGAFDQAEALSLEGMRLAEELDSPEYRVPYLFCLGNVACGRGDYAMGRRYLGEALQIAHEAQLLPPLLFILFAFANLLFKESQTRDAAQPAQRLATARELLSCVIRHPATWQAVHSRAVRLQSQVEATSPAATTAPAESKTLAEVVAGILSSKEQCA